MGENRERALAASSPKVLHLEKNPPSPSATQQLPPTKETNDSKNALAP